MNLNLNVLRFLYIVILLLASCVAKPNWNKDIGPILEKNCVVCHSENGIGPFDLTKYGNVKKRAKTIADVVRNGYMPPWPADKDYTHFIGEKGLTKTEIEQICDWVKDGCKLGNGEELILAVPESQKPKKPDMVLKLPKIEVESDYLDRFYIVKIPGEIEQDRYLQSVFFKTGLTEYVHHFNGHLLLYDYDKKKVLGNSEAEDISYGAKSGADLLKTLLQDDGTAPLRVHSVVNYLPGVFGVKLPSGIGTVPISKKFCFVGNDMHYGPSEKKLIDSSELYLYFTDVKPQREIHELMLGTNGIAPIVPPLQIKPNTISKHKSSYTIKEDISIVTINPHMHMLGKSFKAYAIKPNGDTVRLIAIPQWDFRWQYFYTFKTMVKIPKGSVIVAEGEYDNTVANPNNPNKPPKMVGERLEYGGSSMRATDEMFQFIISYTLYKRGDEFIKLDGGQ